MQTKYTAGPWRVFIDDSGDEDSGFPISIQTTYNGPEGSSIAIVRQGGHYPYSWDEQIPKCEHVANANLIAAAPELVTALAWALDTLKDSPYANEEAYKSAVNLLKRI